MKMFLVSVSVLFILYSCSAQKMSNHSLKNYIQGQADSIRSANNLPGIMIAVINDGYREYFTSGHADPEKQKSFDSATYFEAGSITKTFTAFVVESVLRDFHISDTISILKYLPDSIQVNKTYEKISFVHLLNHTSGLPRLPTNMELSPGDLQPYSNYDSDMLFTYLRTAKPSEQKYAYSNLGMALAGVLAERISGKSYAALLDKYIFLPWKIVTDTNTFEKSENKSQGYLDKSVKAEYWNMNVMAPAGGLICTAEEMLSYLSYLCDPKIKTDALIIKKLLTPTQRINDKVQIGRAWHTFQKEQDPLIYWHNGGTYGFSTFAAFNPLTKNAVLVVINKFNSNAVSDVLGFKILATLDN